MQIIFIILALVLSSGFFFETTAEVNDDQVNKLLTTDSSENLSSIKQRAVRSINSSERINNTSMGPMREVIEFPDPPERDDIIRYENEDDLEYFLTLPSPWDDLSYFVRFTPAEAPFSLIGIEVMLFDMFGDPGNPGMEVSIFSSADDLPDEEIVTFEVPFDDLEFWDGELRVFTEINFEDYEVDDIAFEDEVEFHVVLNAIINEEGDTLGIAMDGQNHRNDRSGLWNGQEEEWSLLDNIQGFEGCNFAIHAVVEYPELGVLINEFMANNADFNVDPQDQFDPWIELVNNTEEEISLDGVFLTNNLDEEDMWAFPEGIVVEPGEHLLIWADGDVNDDGLHTSFTLNPDGGVIGLFIGVEDEIVELDVKRYEEQRVDWSHGRIEDGANDWVDFINPTPGESNEVPDNPIIMLEPFRLEFPLIEGREVRELEVIATNNGELILEIHSISVVGDYFSSPLEDVDEVFLVIPGDENGFAIPVLFEPEDMGEFEGTLIVLSNDPENPEIHIPLTGSGADHLIDISDESIEFGDVEKDDQIPFPFLISNMGDFDLTISGVNIDSEVFLVSFENEQVVEPGGSTEIVIFFSSLVDGQFASQLIIESNDPYDPTLTIEVSASRSGSYIREDINGNIPVRMILSSVYPNPFNSKLQIPFGLPHGAFVSINIYDVSGGLTESVVSENVKPGQYIHSWDAESSPPGIYFVRMKTNYFSAVRKVVLVK